MDRSKVTDKHAQDPEESRANVVPRSLKSHKKNNYTVVVTPLVQLESYSYLLWVLNRPIESINNYEEYVRRKHNWMFRSNLTSRYEKIRDVANFLGIILNSTSWITRGHTFKVEVFNQSTGDVLLHWEGCNMQLPSWKAGLDSIAQLENPDLITRARAEEKAELRRLYALEKDIIWKKTCKGIPELVRAIS